MKNSNLTLLLFIVVLILNSCVSLPGNKTLHKKAISEELIKYSDFLYLSRTRYEMCNRWYSYFGPPPYLGLNLYLRTNCGNRETVTVIRDGLIAYFNFHWKEIADLRKDTLFGNMYDIDAFIEGTKKLQAREIYHYPTIYFSFFHREEEKTKLLYKAVYGYQSGEIGDEEWLTDIE